MSRCPTTSGTCRVCAFWSLADRSIELLPRPGQRCNAPRRRQIASSRGRASPKILSGWLFEHAESLGILGETCQNCFKTCQRSAEKRRPSYNGQKNWGAWLKGVSLNRAPKNLMVHHLPHVCSLETPIFYRHHHVQTPM